VAAELTARGVTVSFAGSARAERKLVAAAGFELDEFRVGGIPREASPAALRALRVATAAPLACVEILRRLRGCHRGRMAGHLRDGEADDEETRKEFYSVIQNQARRLNRLIEDILNISRIESGLIKVSKEQASLTMLIEEQMQMIKSYAEEKNIKIIGIILGIFFWII